MSLIDNSSESKDNTYQMKSGKDAFSPMDLHEINMHFKDKEFLNSDMLKLEILSESSSILSDSLLSNSITNLDKVLDEDCDDNTMVCDVSCISNTLENESINLSPPTLPMDNFDDNVTENVLSTCSNNDSESVSGDNTDSFLDSSDLIPFETFIDMGEF